MRKVPRPASRAACNASQSNNPAASVRAERAIIHEKRQNVFQVAINRHEESQCSE